MILITKEEATAIREKYPQTHIRKTRHKFYMEQAPKAVAMINRLRTQGVITTVYPSRGGKRNG